MTSGNDHRSDDDSLQPEFEPLPKQLATGLAGKAALAAGAVALNAYLPGIAVPVAAVTAALQALGDKLGKQQEARLIELLESASAVSSLSTEEVVRQVTSHEELIIMAAEAIDAARRSRLRGKAAALGRCLGAMLTDDSLVDPESVWLRVISVVEPPHVRILQSLPKRSGPDLKFWGDDVGDGPKFNHDQGMTDREIGKSLGLLDGLLTPLTQDLVNCGLVRFGSTKIVEVDSEMVHGRVMNPTELAVELLRRLHQSSLSE